MQITYCLCYYYPSIANIYYLYFHINIFNRNFTSPHTLRVEVGLANEMEQYDKNFKIRQLMGDFQPKSNMANAKSQKPLKTG